MIEQPPDKEILRTGYVSLPARDFRDKNLWEVLLSDDSIRDAKGRGIQFAKEMGFILPVVLKNPTAIFRGIRWDADEDRATDIPSWLCYVGLPLMSFDAKGNEIAPYDDMVYLAFVNAERVVYHHRWEKCCPDNPRLPIGHNGPGKPRFVERLL